MLCGVCVIQSLSRIQNIVVIPSKHQISIHPQSGKKERVFVDLAAIYPTPEEQGTELSFEEIMAANRGWLDQSWEDETIDESLLPETPPTPQDVDEISELVSEKLVIHQDTVSTKIAIHQDPVEEKLSIHQDSVVEKLTIHKDTTSDKLVIHQDNIVYDENGAVLERPPVARGKKKKVIEVNETQISRSINTMGAYTS